MLFRPNKNGFTLVELLIIVAIMGTLMAVGFPNLVHYIKNNNLKSAARAVAADIMLARESSVAENNSYMIRFSVGGNSYTFERPAGTVLRTVSISSFGSDIQLTATVPSACYAGAATSFNVDNVSFQTRGTLNPTTGTILLKNGRNSTATITYNITGKAHVCFRLQ